MEFLLNFHFAAFITVACTTKKLRHNRLNKNACRCCAINLLELIANFDNVEQTMLKIESPCQIFIRGLL